MENSCQSKVTEFNMSRGIEEDIGWFEITMQHLVCVCVCGGGGGGGGGINT